MAGTDEEEVATEVAGYVVLPLALEKLPSYPVEATHYLYIRAHEPKVPDQDSARSWYVVNTPTNATEGAMRALLADQLGGTLVDRVDFEDDRTAATTTSNRTAAKRNKPRGRVQSLDETVGDVVEAPSYPALWDRRMHKSGSSAVVVFVDRASAELALRFVRKAIKERRKVYWRPEPMPLLGPDRYQAHERLTYPPHDHLQALVDKHVSDFAKYEEGRHALRAQKRNEPDEEGFVTVTRGGRAGPARLHAAEQAAVKLKARQEKMAGSTFYRFQQREKRKERLKKLKKDFEQDVEKLGKLRKLNNT